MHTELAALEHPAASPPETRDWLTLAQVSAPSRTPEALYWTCRAYARLARQATEKLAALPPSPEQHQMLARAYTELAQRSEAISELREAARLAGSDPLIRQQLARALWTDRKYDEAIEILLPLVAANPEQPELQFELGDALFSQGKPEDAVGHLQKAVTLAPDLLPAQAKLGELLLETGDAAAAVPHLERAASLDRDGSIHYQLSVAYRRLGKPELASHALARRDELQRTAKNPSH
jgi:tetratricopeptide (TPR) repeat protein